MTRRIAALTLSLAMILCASIIVIFTPTVKGSTLIVNKTGDDGAYTIIQDAIDNASHGDTVFVYNGTYNENFIVNKTINLTGEDQNTTIVHGDGSGDVINMTADWVNISGFTISGIGSGPDDCGIELNDAQNCTITDCNISDSGLPITVNYTIIDNISAGVTYTIQIITLPNETGGIYDPTMVNLTNMTPISIIYEPLDVLNFTGVHPVNLSYVYTDSLLNYTICGEYILGNWSYLIEIEDPPYYNDTGLITIEHFNITHWDPQVCIIEVNHTLEYSVIQNPIVIIMRPSDPAGLSTTSGESWINLSWRAPPVDHYSSITNYRVYRGTTSGLVTFLVETGNITYYNDTDVSEGVTYFYMVSACNAVGEGPLSNEIEATPMTSFSKSKQPPNENMDLLWILWLVWTVVLAMVLIGAIVNWGESRGRRR